MLMDEIEKKKETIIKIRTKMDRKINEKILWDEIEKKINFKKALTTKQVAIKRIRIKINTNKN